MLRPTMYALEHVNSEVIVSIVQPCAWPVKYHERIYHLQIMHLKPFDKKQFLRNITLYIV